MKKKYNHVLLDKKEKLPYKCILPSEIEDIVRMRAEQQIKKEIKNYESILEDRNEQNNIFKKYIFKKIERLKKKINEDKDKLTISDIDWSESLEGWEFWRNIYYGNLNQVWECYFYDSRNDKLIQNFFGIFEKLQ